MAGRIIVLNCEEAQPVGGVVELAGSGELLQWGRVATAGKIETLEIKLFGS